MQEEVWAYKNDGKWHVVDSAGFFVAGVQHPGPEIMERRAKLCAAAPALRTAVTQLMRLLLITMGAGKATMTDEYARAYHTLEVSGMRGSEVSEALSFKLRRFLIMTTEGSTRDNAGNGTEDMIVVDSEITAYDADDAIRQAASLHKLWSACEMSAVELAPKEATK